MSELFDQNTPDFNFLKHDADIFGERYKEEFAFLDEIQGFLDFVDSLSPTPWARGALEIGPQAIAVEGLLLIQGRYQQVGPEGGENRYSTLLLFGYLKNGGLLCISTEQRGTGEYRTIDYQYNVALVHPSKQIEGIDGVSTGIERDDAKLDPYTVWIEKSHDNKWVKIPNNNPELNKLLVTDFEKLKPIYEQSYTELSAMFRHVELIDDALKTVYDREIIIPHNWGN